MLLVVLLAVVAVAGVCFKSRMTRVTPVVFLACALVTLAAGMGIKLREIVEGPFAYLDNSMQILCGAAFCAVLYANGTFNFLFGKIVAKKRNAALQLLLLALFIGLPGMLTGTALVSVATTGTIAGTYLLSKGVHKGKVVELVSISALIGMVLPPLCLPAILAVVGRAGKYVGSYEGLFLLSLIAVLPSLVIYCLMSGKRIVGELEGESGEQKGNILCLIPLFVVAVLVICHNFFYTVVPFLGYPLIYTIGFVLACLLKADRVNALDCAGRGIRMAAPEVVLMYAFASAVETLTLVGTNGTIAAYFTLISLDATVCALAAFALILVLGMLLGPVPGIACFGAFATYVVSVSDSSSVVMLALGLVFCVVYFAALRGGLVDQTGECLGIEGVSTTEVLKKTWIPAVVLVAMGVLLVLARIACAALII